LYTYVYNGNPIIRQYNILF